MTGTDSYRLARTEADAERPLQNDRQGRRRMLLPHREGDKMTDHDLAAFVRARLKDKAAEAALSHARSGLADEQGPAGRMIAEAKAAYQIANLCDRFLAQGRPDPAGAELARRTLHFLATPYRSHPDFREEWQR